MLTSLKRSATRKAKATKKIVARSTIAKLNASARSFARKNNGDIIGALLSAAGKAGLVEVKRDDDTILFRNKHFAHVNAWIEGPYYSEIAEGGAGFDDQIDWAFE